MVSQNITGKVYDKETTVKGIDVFNLSKQTRAYTDDYGSFTMEATIGDTLSFHSIFHNKKIVKLNDSHFNGVVVFELSKTINRLKEILVQNNITPKEFNSTKEKVVIKEQVANDMKRNLHLYDSYSKYGLDLVRATKLIRSLFKKKKRKNAPTAPILYKDLDSLFSNDPFFNEELLTNNLTIPKEHEQLFLSYCEAKELDKKLLKNENKIILLDSMVTYSQAFLKIIKDSKKK
ncbi:hypothetical protein GCM10022396_30750 [Flavivirga amylovorans]